MFSLRLNHWQRLVVAAASIACLARALLIFLQAPVGGQPGAPFLVGVALAVVAFARPRPEERPWRLIEYLPDRRGRQTAIGVAALLGLALALVFLLRTPQDGAVDNVEMPAEEAMPSDAETAPAGAMAPAGAEVAANADAAAEAAASPVNPDDYVDPFADIANPAEATTGPQPGEDMSGE